MRASPFLLDKYYTLKLDLGFVNRNPLSRGRRLSESETGSVFGSPYTGSMVQCRFKDV